MLPYKTIINLNRKSDRPLYVQLALQFIQLIKTGVLLPSNRLPGTRTLAATLEVHRKTIIACYEDLILQGWVESIPQKGTFVHANIPLLQQKKLTKDASFQQKEYTGFSYNKDIVSTPLSTKKNTGTYYINDGIPDVRLAPLVEIAKIYRYVTAKKNSIPHLGYGTTYGNLGLRNALVHYLNETRGLSVTIDNIIITRGSQMSIYLAAQLLLRNTDYIIVGETNYATANLSFKKAGAQLLAVKVDANGLDTRTIASLCKQYPVKAVYVTPHHHHPTTVTMSAERRMELLNLARLYNFAIIEDDYDYDFNYNHAPILPLASHDVNGNVIYIGSVCKMIAPVYRIGYLIAPKEFVDECAKLRRFIDRQGDALLEMSFARFIQNGDMTRHIKKVLRVYKYRRDLFCSLLTKELSNIIAFEIPKGGMAIWAKLDKQYNWQRIADVTKKHGLIIGNYQRYDPFKTGHNAIRIGFAAYTQEEMHEVISILRQGVCIAYPKINS